jgi:hypothetical protein
VLSTVGLLGSWPAGAEAFALAGPGALRRASGPSLAGVEAALAGTWRAWSQAALAVTRAGACGRPVAAPRG